MNNDELDRERLEQLITTGVRLRGWLARLDAGGTVTIRPGTRPHRDVAAMVQAIEDKFVAEYETNLKRRSSLRRTRKESELSDNYFAVRKRKRLAAWRKRLDQLLTKYLRLYNPQKLEQLSQKYGKEINI